MACIRKRRKKYVVDYRDAAGVRHWITCETKKEAEDELVRVLPGTRQSSRPVVEPNITVSQYSERWLTLLDAGVAGGTLKVRTRRSYKQNLDLHILPSLGKLKVRQLQRGRIKTLLAEKLTGGLSRSSVRIIHATLRGMLNAAVDDGVILANPADRLGRQLRLVKSVKTTSEEIKALDREQLAVFLKAAPVEASRYYPLFLLLARTGMRIGEALALQWENVDFANRKIRVARAFSAGKLETPKSGHGRDVDMSQQLTRALLELQGSRREEQLRCKWPELPPWVFVTDAGTPMDESRVRKIFRSILIAAKLPVHHSPHDLRHTYASLLLQQGESPVYVQRQLGHASIQLTCDLYGRWLPVKSQHGGPDRLDDAVGRVDRGLGATRADRLVANGSSEEQARDRDRATPGKHGGPRRTRTCDPLIKSQLLYQLS